MLFGFLTVMLSLNDGSGDFESVTPAHVAAVVDSLAADVATVGSGVA